MSHERNMKWLNDRRINYRRDPITDKPTESTDQYKVPGCSITAYWNYYEGEKYTVANKDEMIITRNDL